MPDLAAAYDQTRVAMSDLVRDLDADALGVRVPACPDWSVHDLVAHVSSIATAVATGEFPADLNPSAFWDETMAKRREEFIDESLAARRDTSIADILDEWAASTATMLPMMRGEAPWPDASIPLPEWIVLTDVAVHHHDLRGALGVPGERDSVATGLSLRSYVEAMRFRALIEGLPTFTIVAGARTWQIGEGAPIATLTADPFELARAASGRRSPDQVRALGWDGDPEPLLPYFYPYGVRTEALEE
jgi:uncharacterized protein (TIGR03083 family)